MHVVTLEGIQYAKLKRHRSLRSDFEPYRQHPSIVHPWQEITTCNEPFSTVNLKQQGHAESTIVPEECLVPSNGLRGDARDVVVRLVEMRIDITTTDESNQARESSCCLT